MVRIIVWTEQADHDMEQIVAYWSLQAGLLHCL